MRGLYYEGLQFLGNVEGLATSSRVPRLSALALGFFGRRGVGRDGQFGRGGRGPEKARLGLALLVAELLLDGLVFLGEAIDLALFVQAFGTVVKRHDRSRRSTAYSAPWRRPHEDSCSTPHGSPAHGAGGRGDTR